MDATTNKNRDTKAGEMMVITYDQVLKDIEELSQKNPDGFSTAELSDVTGHSGAWCRKHVRKLIEVGKVRYNGKKSIKRIDGATAYIPVYTFVENKNGV